MTAALTVTILPAPAIAGSSLAGSSLGTSSGFNLGSSTKSEELKEFQEGMPAFWFGNNSLNKLAQRKAGNFKPSTDPHWGDHTSCPNCKVSPLEDVGDSQTEGLVYRVPKAEASDFLTWANSQTAHDGYSYGGAVSEDDEYFYVFGVERWE